MIMVDPKQVELSDYNGIPHLLTPVITDMQKVLNSLKWGIVEMEKRYTIFRHSHVRNIGDYNEKMGFAAMPYIIIIIDEMADLMLSSGAEVETAVVKLAQKARATGLHLVLATQRPSVDVITGLIKANIPGRIGMSVATQVDSRVILDQIGAETLLGRGDMLFKEPDKAKPYRVQGVWVSQDEVRRVVKFVKSQAKEVHYTKEVTQRQAAPGASKSALESVKFSEDEFFADAVRIVCNARKGSASLLQRKLSIGYNRAARLLDELQANGVVGPQEGSKPRKVLISDPEEFISRVRKQEGDKEEK
jgi:S-DNA-T family DNA segregation ATPase FtsK/SpoIIIE